MLRQLKTFQNVVDHYNSIKPLVSKHHKREDDIRPLYDRRRKWERIEKVNNNKYILHDVLPEPHSQWSQPYLERPPIVWERKGNKEIITIRPCIRSYDTSRYNFLRNYLPYPLYFDNHTQHGRHTIAGVFIPRPKDRKDETDYHLSFARALNSVTAHAQLGDRWLCATEPWPEARPAVDKKKKAALREHLETFYEWMCTVGPMLPTHNMDFVVRLREEMEEYVSGQTYRYQALRIPTDLALQIVKDYNHPLRTHLAYNFLVREDIKNIVTEEERRSFRSRFQAWSNNTFGLMTEKETTNVG